MKSKTPSRQARTITLDWLPITPPRGYKVAA